MYRGKQSTSRNKNCFFLGAPSCFYLLHLLTVGLPRNTVASGGEGDAVTGTTRGRGVELGRGTTTEVAAGDGEEDTALVPRHPNRTGLAGSQMQPRQLIRDAALVRGQRAITVLEIVSGRSMGNKWMSDVIRGKMVFR